MNKKIKFYYSGSDTYNIFYVDFLLTFINHDHDLRSMKLVSGKIQHWKISRHFENPRL